MNKSSPPPIRYWWKRDVRSIPVSARRADGWVLWCSILKITRINTVMDLTRPSLLLGHKATDISTTKIHPSSLPKNQRFYLNPQSPLYDTVPHEPLSLHHLINFPASSFYVHVTFPHLCIYFSCLNKSIHETSVYSLEEPSRRWGYGYSIALDNTHSDDRSAEGRLESHDDDFIFIFIFIFKKQNKNGFLIAKRSKRNDDDLDDEWSRVRTQKDTVYISERDWCKFCWN